jgi:hypothetical protein
MQVPLEQIIDTNLPFILLIIIIFLNFQNAIIQYLINKYHIYSTIAASHHIASSVLLLHIHILQQQENIWYDSEREHGI